MNIETTAGHLDIHIDPSGTISGEYRAEMAELTPEEAFGNENNTLYTAKDKRTDRIIVGKEQ